jgi:hypothetical protein
MTVIYLSGNGGATADDTFRLADEKGIIVKSFFRRNVEGWQNDNNLKNAEMAAGNDLILAYRNNNGVIVRAKFYKLRNAPNDGVISPLAANEDVIADYRDHMNVPSVFGEVVGGDEVSDLLEIIELLPYARDPKIERFTVVCVKKNERGIVNDQQRDFLNIWKGNLGAPGTTVHIDDLQDLQDAGPIEDIDLPTEPVISPPTEEESKTNDRIGDGVVELPDLQDVDQLASSDSPRKPVISLTTTEEPRTIGRIGAGVDFSGAVNPQQTAWMAVAEARTDGVHLTQLNNG